MPDDTVLTLGADAGDALAALAAVKDAVAAIAEPAARLKTAFAEAGASVQALSAGAAGQIAANAAALIQFNANLQETSRAAARLSRPFRQAFDEIGGGIRSALAGLLSGTETARRAEAQLVRSLAGAGVGIVEGALSKAAAPPLAGLLGGSAAPGDGVGDVLGNTLSRWLFGLPQQAAQGAAATANTAALLANTSAVTGLAATLGASAAGGGLFGWLGGLLGFAHGGIVPGGIVPSAAGGWALPGFAGATPALLHSREMVLPADISQGLQDMIGGGGAKGAGGDAHFHAHFHGPADAPAISRWFRDNLHRNAGAVRDLFRSNALTPRSL